MSELKNALPGEFTRLCHCMNLDTIISANADKRAVICAVINHISITSTRAVIQYGAGAGFSGFIYEHDINKFFMRHKPVIQLWLQEIANKTNSDIRGVLSSYAARRGYVLPSKADVEGLLATKSADISRWSNPAKLAVLTIVEETCSVFIAAA